jgi:hypothetical protein
MGVIPAAMRFLPVETGLYGHTVVHEMIVSHKIIDPPENLTLSVRVDISVNKHQPKSI